MDIQMKNTLTIPIIWNYIKITQLHDPKVADGSF